MRGRNSGALWLMALLAAPLLSQDSRPKDIVIPLEGGTILIKDVEFFHPGSYSGSTIPQLRFVAVNRTSSPWRTLKMQFDIEGSCGPEPRHWSDTLVFGLGWMPTAPINEPREDLVIPLVGKVDGCRSESISAHLLLAESFTVRIDGVTGERVDLEEQARKTKAKEEEQARKAKDEEDAKAAEAARIQAERDADAAARKKRIAEAQKKKQAEDNAALARYRAEREDIEAKRANDEAEQVRAACAEIYRNTADKRVGNLTVKEEQQVRACQALGFYQP